MRHFAIGSAAALVALTCGVAAQAPKASPPVPATGSVLKGHGFSRAVHRQGQSGLQPLRDGGPLVIPVVFTAAPVYNSRAALHGAERFPQGAHLMLLRNGRITPLAPQLAASADSSVSFDGQTILFAGRKIPSDPWQIFRIPANGGDPQLLLSAPTDLIRPFWMPGNRIVYARRQPAGFVLETAALDGSSRLRLSYVPGNFIPDDVLRDGRVLFESGFPLGAATGGSLVLKGHGFSRAANADEFMGASAPEAGFSSSGGPHRRRAGTTPELYTVYSDGSGEEAVRCDHAAARQAGGRADARQLPTGDIVFAQAGRLARFTSALAHQSPIAAPPGDYAGDVAALPDGRWLLSVRRPDRPHYEIAAWTPPAAPRFPGDPEARPAAPTLTTIARDPRLNFVQPVLVAPRPIPNRHPSGLHPWTTGNLLALDARLSRSGELAISPTQVRVETLAPTGSTIVLGTAPVAPDGSFFVQAAADRPLRFVLLDVHGRVVRQERGWFWIRAGEQRVCVGCHAGPERAPDNRVPQILLLSTTPANATGNPNLAPGAF